MPWNTSSRWVVRREISDCVLPDTLRIASADARLEAAAVQHEQAVLSALEDVENAYGMRHALDQRGGVAQSQVQTLPGNRVDAVRRIADQREALGSDLLVFDQDRKPVEWQKSDIVLFFR